MKFQIILLLLSVSLLVNCKGSKQLPKTNVNEEIKPNIEILTATSTETASSKHKNVVLYEYKLKVVVHQNLLKLNYMCTKNTWIDLHLNKTNSKLPTSYQIQSGDTLLLYSSFRNNQLLAACKDTLKPNEIAIHYTIGDSTQMVLKTLISEETK